MTNRDILDKAKAVVNGDRQDSYGQPERNFAVIAEMWSAYLGTQIESHDVALMMALLKIVRCKTGVGSLDSFVDGCGYMALAGEIVCSNIPIGESDEDKAREILSSTFKQFSVGNITTGG